VGEERCHIALVSKQNEKGEVVDGSVWENLLYVLLFNPSLELFLDFSLWGVLSVHMFMCVCVLARAFLYIYIYSFLLLHSDSFYQSSALLVSFIIFCPSD
jgi:hypothetical protein